MVARNMFSIVLFAALFLPAIMAQTTSETIVPTSSETQSAATSANSDPSTTTPPTTTICPSSNQVPFFANGKCISRSAYTGIFLTSIILAGISFLMLLGLLILYCIRHSRGSDSSYASSDRSSISSGSSAGADPSITKRVLGTPLDIPSQKIAGNKYTTVDLHELPVPSAAPYTDTKPVSKPPNRAQPPPTVKPKPVIPKPSNQLEMSTRPSNRPPGNASHPKPSSPPQSTANQGDRNVRARNNNNVQKDDQMSSQF